jgi:hypothetical protein
MVVCHVRAWWSGYPASLQSWGLAGPRGKQPGGVWFWQSHMELRPGGAWVVGSLVEHGSCGPTWSWAWCGSRSGEPSGLEQWLCRPMGWGLGCSFSRRWCGESRGSECQSFGSPLCFTSAECVSSVSARSLIHGAHAVCNCIPVTIFERDTWTIKFNFWTQVPGSFRNKKENLAIFNRCGRMINLNFFCLWTWLTYELVFFSATPILCCKLFSTYCFWFCF